MLCRRIIGYLSSLNIQLETNILRTIAVVTDVCTSFSTGKRQNSLSVKDTNAPSVETQSRIALRKDIGSRNPEKDFFEDI